MKLFNTLSGVKEELAIPEGRPLRMFVCGPTVYNYIHIGNARVYAVFDAFVRYLRSRGINVLYLQNITDLDDKIIERATREKTTWKAVAKKYERAYHEDIKALNIKSVSQYAAATDHMAHIIRQVKLLLRKGHAYEIPGDGIYFDLATFPHYGELARRTVAQAEDGVSRIDESRHKRNRGDFCLWKFSHANGAPRGNTKAPTRMLPEAIWEAPFGAGRPGWHIEDTAITEYYFGPQYDIHGGGRDLIFPHHEAEIAQQESTSGKRPFVRLWMHVGLVTAGGKKMSKSEGNFLFLRDFLPSHPAEVFRLMAAQTHYRAPLDYTKEAATKAAAALSGIKEFMAKLALAMRAATSKAPSAKHVALARAEKAFHAALDDDFNTPEALAAIFKCINDLNPRLWKLTPPETKAIIEWLKEKLGLLGIVLEPPKIPAKIKALAARREAYRSHQQFIPADRLRKQIEALGYRVEDTPHGPLILQKFEILNSKF